jgi:hypothetical protein
MAAQDPDDLVPFQDVRVIRSTGPALLCGIRDRVVWLSRAHVSGKLWCAGDRGTLFIRRSVALDRQLIDVATPDAFTLAESRRRAARLRLVRASQR